MSEENINDEYKTPLPGQEEIFKCIIERDHIALWKLVKYVGYREVPKVNMRKLCFLATFQDFDPKLNNNFITFYTNRLHYFALNDFNARIKGITSDKRALKDFEKYTWWPEKGDEQPVNQNANILRNFVL